MAPKTWRSSESSKALLPALQASQFKGFYANSLMQPRASIGGSVYRAPLDDSHLYPISLQCWGKRTIKSNDTTAMAIEFGR
jgi:hypothetical protein